MPMPKLASASQAKLRAPAMSARHADAATSSIRISRRRSWVSPSGTNSSIPRAVPSCDSIATAPTLGTEMRNVVAISDSSGWM